MWLNLYLFHLPLFPLNYNNIEVKSGQVSQFEDESGDGKAKEQYHSNNITLSLSRSPAEPALAVPCLHAKLLFLFHCYFFPAGES